jgi:predicted HicB family RNase H-like nuclease
MLEETAMSNLKYAAQRERWDLILVRIPKKAGKALREIAMQQEISVAQLAREAITLYLDEPQ